MKKTYISPELNVLNLDPALMAGVSMQASGPGDDMPEVADDDEDIPGGVTGNSKGWAVSFTE